MTYAAYQSRLFGKTNIWLYRFTINGETKYYRRAKPGLGNTTLMSLTWEPAVIMHNRYGVTGNIKKSQLTVTVPRNNTFFEQLVNEQLLTTSMTIMHGYEEDPDQEFVTKFVGKVIGVRPILGAINILCGNELIDLGHKGLGRVIQRPCQHALYHSKDGVGCEVNKALFAVAATVSSLDELSLTVPAAAGYENGYFNWGLLEFDGKSQMIESHTGSTINLLGPVNGLTASSSITIYPGCNLTRAQCASRFNNSDNHGGFPTIKNSPFNGSMLY